MNDKPNTLKIDVLEWKMLSVQSVARLADGISSLGEHLNKQSVINPQMIGEIDAYWANARAAIDRQWAEVQVRLKGWEQHSRPLVAEWEAQNQKQAAHIEQEMKTVQAQPLQPVEEIQSPRRKGGWPRGKKRTPKPNQSAAALPPVTQ